jgi:hypothetical protein
MAVWDFTWTLSYHRNDVLHNSDVHNKLLDMDAIDLAIIKEWQAEGRELTAPEPPSTMPSHPMTRHCNGPYPISNAPKTFS